MIEQKKDYLIKIDKNQVLALIPARGGSKGVPKKNIQRVKGYPLIAYSIVAAKLSEEIHRVIVSTDSEEIARIALQFGAEVPFLRPKEFASDLSGDIEFVEHAIQYLYDKERSIPEYLVHLRATTPLREIEIIDRAIAYCREHQECCSLRSAHVASESPYKWFLKSQEGYYKSMQEGLDNDTANTARQNFPDVYIPDGYVDVIKSSYVIQNHKLHGDKMLAFVSPDCTEVDTVEDLDYIKYQIEKSGSKLYEYLKQNF
ncbi:acylneuraminate cytidylyltransferase family protein [Clostridiaceae bacterium]|nr:acylneuraminate cytidylyltransferase family protein [Clostridiaceae bacterium]RKI17910.1 acylneuraminate cytidylyltransferase family protein [bacterium 1XD21-70]